MATPRAARTAYGAAFIKAMEAFVRRTGLELREDVGAAEHRLRYLEPVGRALEVFEIERVARAQVR